MADRMTPGEVRAMPDRNPDWVSALHGSVLTRRAADRATAVCKPVPVPATPSRNAKPAKPRIGHRMRELQAVVSAVPGISKSDALRAAGLPTHGLGSGRELNRAISAGLIIVEHEHARRTHLFASERDRRRWHLTREVLTPGIPAGRVAEIRAEITALDAGPAVVTRSSTIP